MTLKQKDAEYFRASAQADILRNLDGLSHQLLSANDWAASFIEARLLMWREKLVQLCGSQAEADQLIFWYNHRPHRAEARRLAFLLVS